MAVNGIGGGMGGVPSSIANGASSDAGGIQGQIDKAAKALGMDPQKLKDLIAEALKKDDKPAESGGGEKPSGGGEAGQKEDKQDLNGDGKVDEKDAAIAAAIKELVKSMKQNGEGTQPTDGSNGPSPQGAIDAPASSETAAA
jgi:hypothetical protein